MDVDAVSFPSRLLGMLIAISEADFVSLDLELSGVSSKLPGAARRKQTLEQRYAEVKAGADKYQVLQVGITCARFDYLKDKYVLRPYNINISPLIEEQLDIERIFSFQSGAVEFLMRNGFNMELPFTKGVQYLSREEAKRAKRLAYNRLDNKNVIEDLQLEDDAVESLEFCRKVREEIIKWKATGTGAVDISSTVGDKVQPQVPTISRFEKRLVHQLVRAEFPELVTISKQGFIRVILHDAVREADIVRKKKNKVKEQIVKQTGFRWIVEALVKGDLHPIDPMYFSKDRGGFVIAANLDNIKGRFGRAAARIQDHQPVLVGHNMFTDLLYFYRCFIGELPETVEEFSEAIHKLFPRIVDTKYLATHNCGDINPSCSLQEIAEGLEKQLLPNIVTHPDHSKYHETEAFHEAGYDSLLTATIMIRLSAKLKVQEAYLERQAQSESDGNYETALEDIDGVVNINPEKADSKHHDSVRVAPVLEPSPEPETPKSTPIPLGAPPSLASSQVAPPVKNKKKKTKKKRKNSTSSKAVGGRYAHNTMFEHLRNWALQSDDEAEPEKTAEVTEAPMTDRPAWEDERDQQGTSDWHPVDTLQREPMEMMPGFGSEFWTIYGNKLRIFGTVESALKIADWA